MQQALVADHIHELQQEAAAIRAERERDVRATPRGADTGPRRRLGAWLIGVGEAIAGRSVDGVGRSIDAVGDCGDPIAA